VELSIDFAAGQRQYTIHALYDGKKVSHPCFKCLNLQLIQPFYLLIFHRSLIWRPFTHTPQPDFH